MERYAIKTCVADCANAPNLDNDGDANFTESITNST